MSQEIVARILDFEQHASQVYADAQREAAQLVEDARKVVDAVRAERIDKARERAEELRATGQAQAEAERKRILAQVEAEMDELEIRAAENLDTAVTFILGEVAGRE